MSRYTQPDPAAIALVTVDLQCDTLDGGACEVPGTSESLGRIRELIDRFRRGARPIVHVVRIYKDDGSNVDACLRAEFEDGSLEFLIAGSRGVELAPDLFMPRYVQLDTDVLLGGGVQEVGNNEVVMYKPRWGAFYRTSLKSHLIECGVNTVAFVGANFPNCPRASVYQASERDFRVVVAADAVSGLYDRGIEELRAIGVDVTTCAQLLEALD